MLFEYQRINFPTENPKVHKEYISQKKIEGRDFNMIIFIL